MNMPNIEHIELNSDSEDRKAYPNRPMGVLIISFVWTVIIRLANFYTS